jgi:hypothetical protein
MKKILFLLMMSALLFSSCSKEDETDPSATPAVSSAIFEIPTSLTGEAVSSRSVTSDAKVGNNVKGYYELARSQVKIARSASTSIRNLIADFEAVSIKGVSLFDYPDNIQHTENDGSKIKWTVQGNNTFLFEKWKDVSTDVSPNAYLKTVEFTLTRNTPHYSGTVILKAEDSSWTPSSTGVQSPEVYKIVFDNNSDGNGLHTLDIYLQDFRFSADLETGTYEDAILKFTKDSAGAVTLASLIYVPGSRHFVWDGYTKNASNVEVLNTGSTPETRCYVITGKADASNRATINLSLPKEDFVAATMLTQYSIGAVIRQLFADRLNNNYSFDYDAAGTNNYNEGHEIIGFINTINTNAGNNTVLLDTITPVSENTPTRVFDALTAVNAALADGAPGKEAIEFFLGIMSVENPAYFNGSSYVGNGATTPAGYITPAELSSLSYPTEDEVKDLNLAGQFQNDPGF